MSYKKNLQIIESGFQGIFKLDKDRKAVFFTKNLLPSCSVYGERLVKQGNNEFREFSPQASKLASAFRRGLSRFNLNEKSIVLYLGASTGTTVSHLSDICTKGMIFAVESAPVVARELVFLAEKRNNIAPILADANKPEDYKKNIVSADFLYQDVAQKNQVQIFLKNLEFLKKNGLAFLIIKARSIDFAKEPEQVFESVEAKIKSKVNMLQKINISSFQKGHCVFVCRKG